MPAIAMRDQQHHRKTSAHQPIEADMVAFVQALARAAARECWSAAKTEAHSSHHDAGTPPAQKAS